MSAAEKETRLGEVLPDTTSLCGLVEALSEALSVSLAELEQGFPVDNEEDVFVLQQASKLIGSAMTAPSQLSLLIPAFQLIA